MKRVHFSLELPKWHEWLVYSTAAVLTATGIAWLLLDRFGKVEGEFGPEQSPYLPWLLVVHGAIAYAFLIVAAMLLPVHVRLGWNAMRNRVTGLLLISVAAILAASGLLLYYASGEGLRSASSAAHWIVGLALPIALVVHVIRGKASQPVPKRHK